jgi:hypothetical protein
MEKFGSGINIPDPQQSLILIGLKNLSTSNICNLPKDIFLQISVPLSTDSIKMA